MAEERVLVRRGEEARENIVTWVLEDEHHDIPVLWWDHKAGKAEERQQGQRREPRRGTEVSLRASSVCFDVLGPDPSLLADLISVYLLVYHSHCLCSCLYVLSQPGEEEDLSFEDERPGRACRRELGQHMRPILQTRACEKDESDTDRYKSVCIG